MSGLQSQQSQESLGTDDDDDDYMEQQVRKEFGKIQTSTWMAKKIDGMTGELGKLVKEHEKSKKDLIKPVKKMMRENPDMNSSLTLLTSLFSVSLMRARTAICVACSLSRPRRSRRRWQEKIVEKVQTLMQTIELGKVMRDPRGEES